MVILRFPRKLTIKNRSVIHCTLRQIENFFKKGFLSILKKIYLPEQLCWNIFWKWYIDVQFLIWNFSVLSFFLFSTATDPKIPLKINVKDKDDPLGQILIPLSDIPSEEHFLKWVTLGPHKKNISPCEKVC